ncbi:DsrE family protein [Alteromonas ponticola]|uniref:DsrE family protein n=1 Tax=Alteromonas aquimaris TaxID=2998417 RepID=A0ABT3PAT8_9ALTE|nr:DsrE family protein [Alteromonas aquimaris]MCW8109885.1 DsrE family protein [Alteromonas aquimaris]
MARFTILASCLLSCSLSAGEFSTGPVFDDFGKHTATDGIHFEKGQTFKVVFDIAKDAEVGTLNRSFNSLARFINMHVANGIDMSNLQLAMVVHGAATHDLLTSKAYEKRHNSPSENVVLVNSLLEKGVSILVCGQSAAAHKIEKNELLPGVRVVLSAMTANAMLQQQGYTLNPF